MTAARTHTVSVDGAPIVLREWGDESALPVVHWPGLGTYTGEYLFELGPLLAEHGVRVIALDPPGIGASPRLPLERYRADELGRLLIGGVGALELTDAVLMGASWGAVVACEAAALAPERCRGLVLLDGGYFDHSRVRGWQLPLDEHVRRAGEEEWRFKDREALLSALEEHFGTLSPGLAAYWLSTVEERDGELVDTADTEVMGAGLWGLVQPRPPIAARLEAAAVPLLLLVADAGWPSEAEAQELGVSRADMEGWRNDGLDAFRALSRSTVIELAGVPHDMIAVAAPRVAELVSQWLPQVR
ncbi:MAG TPA: alpha/beta fold hydrolase [Gaiellales bacterium]|jgi:pimeloyl-ACP methyl ester carboxylesterase|nr:alpha/beta fold hydrolase [Gaiellales bacterium]